MLSDFGSSRVVLASISLVQLSLTPKGTRLYLAPEFINTVCGTTRHSFKTDIWALGMTFYVCLSASIFLMEVNVFPAFRVQTTPVLRTE